MFVLRDLFDSKTRKVIYNEIVPEVMEQTLLNVVNDKLSKGVDSNKDLSIKIINLEIKVNELKKENLQLMETIQPCPLPDQALTQEIERLNKHMNAVECTYK